MRLNWADNFISVHDVEISNRLIVENRKNLRFITYLYDNNDRHILFIIYTVTVGNAYTSKDVKIRVNKIYRKYRKFLSQIRRYGASVFLVNRHVTYSIYIWVYHKVKDTV